MFWKNEDKYNVIIQNAAIRYNVPYSLVKAVIAAESGFNARAIREEPQISDASRGLMQVLEKTARALGFSGSEETLFDPYTNINLGTKLLARERARTDDWDSAISAYNGGVRPHLGFGERVTEEGVRCMGRIVPIGQFCNQDYVNRVRKYWNYFETGEMPPDPSTMIGVAVLAGMLLVPFL